MGGFLELDESQSQVMKFPSVWQAKFSTGEVRPEKSSETEFV